jgi:hypothetical protein
VLPAAAGFGGNVGCYRSTGGAAATCLDPERRSPRGSLDSVLTIRPDAEIFYSAEPGPAVMPFVNTVSVAPPGETLFSDGFESGALAAWSARSGRGLTVEPAAALEGAFGLRVEAPLGGEAVVRDDRPASESAYHARFRLDARAFGGRGAARCCRPRSSAAPAPAIARCSRSSSSAGIVSCSSPGGCCPTRAA